MGKNSGEIKRYKEYKADFDRALNALGKGEWDGKTENHKWGEYRGFGRLQRLVIGDIYHQEN